MTVPVTRTKIIVPQPRFDLLTRPRLLEMLKDVLDYPLTLISAPAGYGKTSLLIDFAQGAEHPVTWFKIDSLDQDITRFLYHLAASIDAAFPSCGTRMFSAIDNIENIHRDQDQIIRIFVNEIYDNISEHFVMLLDDFHLVNNESHIVNFINRFMLDMSDNCHLILASRTQIALPDLPLMVGRSQVKAIGYEDLAFQADEIQELLYQKHHLEISKEESQSLANKTEGWITGLLLSLKTASPVPDQTRASRITGINLFNYLAQQVFDGQPKQIKDFLLRTSYMGEFNAEFCTEVLGKPPKGMTWGGLIQEVLQDNLFVQPLENGSTWLRYHQLFEDFLQEEFLRSAPEARNELLFRLKDIYAQNNQWEKAYDASKKINSTLVLADLIDQASSPLFHSGRINLLASWLEELPQSGFEHCPRLLVLKGIITTLQGNPISGLDILTKSIKKPPIQNNKNDLSRALICIATSHRLLGKYKEALENSQKVLNISEETRIDITLVAEVNRELGLAYLFMGNLDKARDGLQKSLETYENNNDFKNAAIVQLDLGVLYMTQGEYDKAQLKYIDALNLWKELDNENQQVVLMNNLGVISHNKGEYKAAYKWFCTAIALSEKNANIRLNAYITTSLGDLAFDIGLYLTSEKYYEHANNLVQKSREGYLVSYLHLCFSAIYRKQDKFNMARHHIEEAFGLITESDSIDLLGLWHLERARLDIRTDRVKSAEKNLRTALDIFIKLNKPVDIAKTYLNLMITYHLLNKDTKALKNLNEANTILKPIGSIKPILPELYAYRTYFNELIDKKKLTPLYETLNNNLDEFHDDVASYKALFSPVKVKGDSEFPRLKIEALGTTKVLIHGIKISSPEWTQQKMVREIFFYLLSESLPISKDQIGLIFWPNSSKKQLNCQFKNAIYRLRKSIGKDAIIYDQFSRTYSFNKSIDYNYDVESFHEVFSKAQSESNLSTRKQYLREVLSIYKHPFGKNLDGVWTEPIRRDLYTKFERAIIELIELNLENDCFEENIDICEKLLDLEPTQEKCWQLLMETYANMNDRNGIIRSYEECKNKLKVHLGLAPSKDTEVLYKKLLQ